MNNAVVTRFAPSPTGYLHIGGARTALFNYLFSKANGGKFLLRIEDTDEKRSTDAAIDAILQGLDWLGLKHDDNYVLQSKNLVRHAQVAQELLSNGKAYLCYTAAEELDEMRKAAEKKGEVFRFKSSWRDKAQSQASVVKPVIRIKAPLDGEVVIKDLVQGEVRVAGKELDDLVMLRGDGTPTYMLAVVVDDRDMGITHVIRGDDHFTNAFRQKIIYEAMGWEVPQFAHIPLIHGADGAKMSKRHGATSVIEYQQMGYLPEAMRNYLLRLGWSHGDDEIISDAQAAQWFNLEKVGKSPARFDFAKLNHVNKHYIKEKTEAELLELIAPFLNANIADIDKLLVPALDSADNFSSKELSSDEKARIIRALKFLKERAETVKDLAKSAMVYCDDFTAALDDAALTLVAEKRAIINDLQKILVDLKEWNHDAIKQALSGFAETHSLKIKDFGPALRAVLTFSLASAGGVFDVIEILGQQETVKRISGAPLKKPQNRPLNLLINIMKNLRTLVFASLATLLVFLPFSSFAAMRDSFFFEPFATVEYSAPKFYGDTNAKGFATDSIFTQLKNFDNIVLGFHGRIHKYIGLNVNWSQTDMESGTLTGYALEKRASLGLDYLNFSGLFFVPVIEDSIVELFGEVGVSKMKSKISIFETNGNYTKKKTSDTIPFIGFGFQVAPFESSKDAFRISFQRYLGKLDLIHANFSTIRIGYVKAF